MKGLIIASIVAAALALSAEAQVQNQNPQSNQQDASFIRKAAEVNLTEVEMGRLGAQKSQNPQIQQFSKHLETDHQSANQKLQTIAQSQGVQFPQSVGSKEQQKLNKLQGLSGKQFDQQFAETALKGHAKALQLYQKEAQRSQNPAIKQYAQSMVPVLEHHLTMAKDVAQNVGVSQSTISSITSRYPGATGGATTPGGTSQQGAGSSQGGY